MRELYAGNGRVYLAKRKADGSTEPRFWLGNVSYFLVNFRTGEVKLTVEELTDDALEVICGSPVSESRVTLEFDDGDVQVRDASQFQIGDSAPFEYELTFSGINTAQNDGNNDFTRWKVVLHRLTTTSSEGWDLISDGFASIKIGGVAHKDERHGNKIGIVYRLHKESATGNRLTDVQQVVATV